MTPPHQCDVFRAAFRDLAMFLFDGFLKVTKETGWISHHLVLMLVTSSTQEVGGHQRETGQQETKHLGALVMGEHYWT